MKKCPFCKNTINDDTCKCEYCERIIKEDISQSFVTENVSNNSIHNGIQHNIDRESYIDRDRVLNLIKKMNSGFLYNQYIKRQQDPLKKCALKRILNYKDPSNAFLLLEKEIDSNNNLIINAVKFTDNFIIKPSSANTILVAYLEIVWAYIKHTSDTINFTTTEYWEINLITIHDELLIFHAGSEKNADEIMNIIRYKNPLAKLGYNYKYNSEVVNGLIKNYLENIPKSNIRDNIII